MLDMLVLDILDMLVLDTLAMPTRLLLLPLPMDTQVLLLPLLSTDIPVLDTDMPDTTASVRLRPKLIPMLMLTLSLRSGSITLHSWSVTKRSHWLWGLEGCLWSSIMTEIIVASNALDNFSSGQLDVGHALVVDCHTWSIQI